MLKVFFLLAICGLATVSSEISMSKIVGESVSNGPQEQHDGISAGWDMFKKFFKRKFSDAIEEGERFFIFARNFLLISQHNSEFEAGKKTYELALNKFSDKRASELMKLRGYRSILKKHRSAPVGSTYLSPAVLPQLPSQVDWRTKGAVTPVKDQGQCGSCWAFSTTGSLEGQHFKKTGKLVSLSEQQLVDCSQAYGNMACNGGLMDNAFDYVQNNHGIDSEKSYPYISGRTGHAESRCHFKKRDVSAGDTGFVDIRVGDEEQLKEAVATIGPVSVAINANRPDFMSYRRGVYNPEDCPGEQNDLDHGVLVVGYGSEKGQDYWIVKNSWGPEWGEGGYIRMARNKGNLCGIASSASYPLV